MTRMDADEEGRMRFLGGAEELDGMDGIIGAWDGAIEM